MSDLRDISTTMHKICNDMVRNGDQLSVYAQVVEQMTATVQHMLSGSSTGLHTQVVTVLLQSMNDLRTASQKLQIASDAGNRWLQSHGCGITQEVHASATNSYERSLMTEQEANVFLRMKSKLSNTLMSCLPQSRVEAVDAAYVNAPQYVTALISRFSSKLQGIHNSGEKGGCWYSPYERSLFMDEGMNHAEYTDVIKHEMGHFIDHMMGSPSGSPAFLAAMEQDRQSFDASSPGGCLRMADMLDDLFNTGACYDRNVTDILSALFRNDAVVLNRFTQESITGYVAYYQHDTNTYWDKCDMNGNSLNLRGKEIFANCFAIETDGYRISRDFVERWFPNVFAQMQTQLSGGNC